MLSDFHFLRPEWLLALPLVLAAAFVFAHRRLGAGHWENVIDPALAPYVLSTTQSRQSDYRWLLFALAGVIAVTALAGPAWQRIEQPVFRSEQALVVALDLSRSMDAEDVKPSRIARARLKILDLLQRRASGQTALVVYSSNAFTVTPLTTDTDTVAALVTSLETDIMPSRGSYPVAAIRKGRQLLDQAGVGSGEVLLITDGGTSPAAERAARDLLDAGYTLSVLGVGTPDGAPIPRAGGGFVTGPAGDIAVPRLEENSLEDMAAAGGGRYARLTAGPSDLDYLLAGEAMSATAEDENQMTDAWHEEGPWLVLLLLPLAALAFRRGWLFVAVFGVLPLSAPAEASLWEDLWLNENQQAKKLLEEGEPDAAADLFDDDDWQAVARYRAGDFARSAEGFAENADNRNLYNLGNALAMQGQFEAAIETYERVLEIDPRNEDAAYNLALLQSAEQQQQQNREQGDQQESQQSPGEDGEQSNEPSDSEDASDSDAQADGDAEETEPGQRPEDGATEEDMQALQQELERAAREAGEQQAEQQLTEEQLAELRRQQAEEQAMEQWLRRIPNDPGGLLRRKFRYQYQRMGKDQDGNDLWPDDERQPW